MKVYFKFITIIFSLLFVAFTANAAPLTTSKNNISTKTSLELVENALQVAGSKKLLISVVVVDTYGNVIARAQDNNINIAASEVSFKKAYTSAAFGTKTSDLLNVVNSMPKLKFLAESNVIFLGGGFPLFIKGELVGGIGIAGAPSPDLDEEIIFETLKRVGFSN